MDTNNSAPEIPDFKLAKVGQDRKRRKKAGAPFGWGSPKGRGFWGLSSGGGAGAGSAGLGLSTLGGKIAVALLVGTLGVGAYSVGKVLAPDAGRFEAPQKKLFASHEKPKYEGDLSNLPGRDNYQSGLGMVSGSLDGLTPEERAAKLKEAEERARAEAEEKARAEEEAAAKEKEDAAAATAGAPVDAAALVAGAAGAAGNAKKGFSRSFGELSKSLGGGGLAGGSGLAGGVTRTFDLAKLKGDSGKLGSYSSNKTAAMRKAATPRPAKVGRAKSLARRQLDSAHALSNAARAGTGETSSTLASQAFDSNPASGNGITGAGAGTGEVGSGTSGGSSNPGNWGSGPSPVGSSSSGSDDPGSDENCAAFGDSYVLASDGTCVPSEKGHSVDPTDPYFKILTILAALGLLVAAVLTLVGYMPESAPKEMIIKVLGGILTAIGAMEAMMGMLIMGMGRTIEGGIFAIMGLGSAAAGAYAMASAEFTAGLRERMTIGSTYFIVQALSAACQAGGLGGSMFRKWR